MHTHNGRRMYLRTRPGPPLLRAAATFLPAARKNSFWYYPPQWMREEEEGGLVKEEEEEAKLPTADVATSVVQGKQNQGDACRRPAAEAQEERGGGRGGNA